MSVYVISNCKSYLFKHLLLHMYKQTVKKHLLNIKYKPRFFQ